MTGYIFDIFSKYKNVIQKDQLIQVIQIFSDLPEEVIKSDIDKVHSLEKPEFLQMCKNLGFRLHYFSKFQSLFIVEFGLKPTGPEAELEAIRHCLDGEPDIKEYMQSSL